MAKTRCNKFEKEIKINEKKEVVKVTKGMVAKKARVLEDFDVYERRDADDFRQILSVCIGQPEWVLNEKFRSIRDEILK